MKKQQIKSQNTRRKILQAAAELFAVEGYDAVSVADIVDKAECSVGAFYGHFKSKEVLVTRLWLYVTTELISEAVEKGSHIQDRVAFVDYLVEHSAECAKHPLMNSLYRYVHVDEEGSRELASYASRFLSMIRNVLHAYAPDASEDVLWTYASIIHSLLNAHSRCTGDPSEYFKFSNEVVRQAILALMDICKNQPKNQQ